MQLTRTCIADDTSSTSADFVFERGITFRSTFTFTNPDDTPLDITLIDVVFHLRETSATADYLTLTSGEAATINGSEVTIINGPGGIAEVLVTDEETALMTFNTTVWWLTLKLANGDIVLRGKGEITITEPYV